MTDPAPEPLPPDEETDEDGCTGDFYEDDEPYEKILYQWEHGTPAITAPPPGWTGPVYLPPREYLEEVGVSDEELRELLERAGDGITVVPPSDWQP